MSLAKNKNKTKEKFTSTARATHYDHNNISHHYQTSKCRVITLCAEITDLVNVAGHNCLYIPPRRLHCPAKRGDRLASSTGPDMPPPDHADRH